MNIINGKEVKYYAGLPAEFPECDLWTISQVVENEFYECLGSAFKDILIEDLEEHDYEEFSQKTWAIGQKVSYRGLIYVANKSTAQAPSFKDDWDLAKKFKTDCYNSLWCDASLARFLALAVKKDQLPHIFIKTTGAGLVQTFSQGHKAVGEAEYKIVSRATNRDIEKVFKVMDRWMKANNSTGCFDAYKGIAKSCCSECGCKEEECVCDCIQAKKSKNRSWRIA